MKTIFENRLSVDYYDSVVEINQAAEEEWRLNYSPQTTQLLQFLVSNNQMRIVSDNERPFYSNILIDAQTKTYVSVLGLLNGGMHPVDLTLYRSLRFLAGGGHLLRITLKKKSIEKDEHQYSCLVKLANIPSVYVINFSDFLSDATREAFVANDITAIEFHIESDAKGMVHLVTTIANIGFLKETKEDYFKREVLSVQINPNPCKGNFVCSFHANADEHTTITVAEIATGNIVYQQLFCVVKGQNQCPVQLPALLNSRLFAVMVTSRMAEYQRKNITVVN